MKIGISSRIGARLRGERDFIGISRLESAEFTRLRISAPVDGLAKIDPFDCKSGHRKSLILGFTKSASEIRLPNATRVQIASVYNAYLPPKLVRALAGVLRERRMILKPQAVIFEALASTCAVYQASKQPASGTS
ncbi:MAG: hypothetical protein LBU32_16330 [Clostridiales bacterium]|jgi:hypothetical protein|nr:hypothetical protein [Clostridiales bacterium]